MKIITDCPYCDKSFMYDPNSDKHLVRELKVLNDQTGQKRTSVFICQDCDADENKTILNDN